MHSSWYVERLPSPPTPINHCHLAQFKFGHYSDWIGLCRSQWDGWPPETMRTLYPYSDPFNNECRAFGRLREAGCEDLAVKCFGYVLLDEESEQQLHSLPISPPGFVPEFLQ